MKTLVLLIVIYLIGFYSGFQYRGSSDISTAIKEHASEIKSSVTKTGKNLLKQIDESSVDD